MDLNVLAFRFVQQLTSEQKRAISNREWPALLATCGPPLALEWLQMSAGGQSAKNYVRKVKRN